MSSVAIQGNASGAGVFTIASPNSASSYTATLPAATTTLVGTDATQTLTNKTLGSGLVAGASLITSGTAVASTSGTSIDFTSIPSWVKRITVMLNGVSVSATGAPLVVRIGSGSFEATGYVAGYGFTREDAVADTAVSTTYFIVSAYTAIADTMNGSLIITNVSGNLWVAQGVVWRDSAADDAMFSIAGSKTTSGVLDRLQITTSTAVPTFDAGTINILYE